jgi:hypothetical protein
MPIIIILLAQEMVLHFLHYILQSYATSYGIFLYIKHEFSQEQFLLITDERMNIFGEDGNPINKKCNCRENNAFGPTY